MHLPQFLLLTGETPCERRLLRIRAASGAWHVVVMSGMAHLASSRGDDARGAYVAAAVHSNATGPAVLNSVSGLATPITPQIQPFDLRDVGK
jgi:hypothetical protein